MRQDDAFTMRRLLLALALAGCGTSPSPSGPADGSIVAPGPDVTDPPPDLPAPDVPPLGPAAPNATCAQALTLIPGMALPAQPLARGVEVPSTCAGDGFAPSPALWYRVRVPAGQHLAVSVRRPPDSRTNVSLRAFRGCGGSCVLGSDLRGDDVPSLRWTNTGPDADVVLALAAGIRSVDLPSDVLVTLQTPPAHVACAAAAPLVDGTPRAGEDLAFAVDTLPACAARAKPGIRPMFFRATVPARRTLSVSVRGEGHVAILPACGTTTCLAWSDPASGRATTSWANEGDATREVIVAVGHRADSVPGTVDVAATTSEPAPHGRCATPRRLAASEWLRDELVGADGDATRACTTEMPDGPGRYYALRVGPGEELSATATALPGGAPTVSLRVVDGCAASGCLASDAHGAPSAWVRFRNEGTSPRELLLEASAPAGRVARFDLRLRVAPPGYTVTTIAAACDDMTGAAGVPVPSGKIFPAESQALPFPLRYFGEPVTEWSVSNYGYLELWPEHGRTRPSAVPRPFPFSGVSRVVAPFWSPMNSTASPFVVARTVEAPRRHLAVQWTDANVGAFVPDGDGGAVTDRLTFQAHLYADDTIEFHYCAVAPGDAASGANATIGLHGDVVPRAVPYAYRQTGVVMTGTALRFRP